MPCVRLCVCICACVCGEGRMALDGHLCYHKWGDSWRSSFIIELRTITLQTWPLTPIRWVCTTYPILPKLLMFGYISLYSCHCCWNHSSFDATSPSSKTHEDSLVIVQLVTITSFHWTYCLQMIEVPIALSLIWRCALCAKSAIQIICMRMVIINLWLIGH